MMRRLAVRAALVGGAFSGAVAEGGKAAWAGEADPVGASGPPGTDGNRQPPHEVLRRAGIRPTRPRLVVLGVLDDPRCQAMAVHDLYREMLLRDSPLSLSTIYAVLQTFKLHQLVSVEREAEGLQRFSRMGG